MITARTDVQVAAPPEEAFDKLADMRNELHWNEIVTEMQKATEGEIGRGTRYEGRMKKGIGPMYMEIVEYERPNRLRMRGGGRSAAVDFAAIFTPSDGGTTVGATLNLEPKESASSSRRSCAAPSRETRRRRWRASSAGSRAGGGPTRCRRRSCRPRP